MALPIDYYKVLSINRDATELSIKQAYQRAALQSHPVKNKSGDTLTLKKQFELITEAYDVLSDPERRAIFDQFGERGLKSGVTLEDGAKTQTYSFSENPEAMFERMFGTSSPFSAQFTYDTNPALLEEKEIAAKPPTQEIKVFASLEEIYSGCVKNLKVTRRKDAVDGTTQMDERSLLVEIGRGWKPGTRITFEGEGDCAVVNGKQYVGDVQFILCDRPHPVFKRLPNNDLSYTHTLTLSEALCGSVLTLKSLDGRILTIALSDVIGPGSRHTVAGEGMPKANGQSANLVIEFVLKFPEQLSMTQKQALKQVLSE